MNRSEQHPDSIALDRLRAGLLDDDPRHKAALEQHLQQCEHCRRAHDWPAAVRGAATEVDERLDHLRRRVLATPAVNRSRQWRPLAVAAALALVAVGLFDLLSPPETSQPQVATSTQRVPDVYEDLDFYLWLADHKSTGDSST
jgi:ferric-dicitrate binding protein FerR (iron transport regulator)